MFGLDPEDKKKVGKYSLGMKQKLALAMAFLEDPQILILDEPLSAIDALLRRNLQIEIRRIQQKLKITTIFVTHDQEEAMVMSDTIHLFNLGQIEQSGSPEEIYAGPKTEFAANFIGHYNILKSADLAARANLKAESQMVAIRPEAFTISATPEEGAGKVQLKGVVKSAMSRGTTVVYTVDCNGIEINADRLFSSSGRLADGSEVYLSVPREDVLELR